MTTAVRRRTSADLEACAAALVRVHQTDGYPVEGVADALAWLTPTKLQEAWVAELSSQIVGHAAVSAAQDGDDAAHLWSQRSGTSIDSILILGRLFVVPEARGQSLGEQLTRTAMTEARQRGQPLVLDVMAKDTAAIRLYERLGWQHLGTATHTYGDDQETPAHCYIAPAQTL